MQILKVFQSKSANQTPEQLRDKYLKTKERLAELKAEEISLCKSALTGISNDIELSDRLSEIYNEQSFCLVGMAEIRKMLSGLFEKQMLDEYICSEDKLSAAQGVAVELEHLCGHALAQAVSLLCVHPGAGFKTIVDMIQEAVEAFKTRNGQSLYGVPFGDVFLDSYATKPAPPCEFDGLKETMDKFFRTRKMKPENADWNNTLRVKIIRMIGEAEEKETGNHV